MSLAHVEDFVGIGGHTTDVEFSNLVNSLESFCKVWADKEEYNSLSVLVTTVYKETITGKLYELWYQVRTPLSPMGMEFAFGFDRWEPKS